MPPAAYPNRERVDRYGEDRGYFRKASRLVQVKNALAIAAFIIAAGWLAAGWVLPREVRQARYTHGPLTRAHAAWDHNCEACHAPSSAADVKLTEILDAHGRWRKFRCDSCHSGQEIWDAEHTTLLGHDPYAPHHPKVALPADAAGNCADCHKDHQGRDHSLVTIADSACTSCHGDLAAHHVNKTTDFATKIVSFQEGHPEFHAVAQGYQRTLKFNHALHLTPGLIGPREQNPMILRYIPLEFQSLYVRPGQGLDGKVQLDCASCHQLEGGLPVSEQSVRSSGSLMLPVKYALHCQACHPLAATFQLPKPLEGSVVGVKVPHGKQFEELRTVLRAEVIEGMSRGKFNAAKQQPAQVGKARVDPPALIASAKDFADAADVAVQRIEAALFANKSGGCLKCHTGSLLDTVAVIKPDATRWEITPPNTPPIWMPHSRFNHSSHRAMSCISCHDKLVSKDEKDPLEPLNLPGIASCQRCHAPAGESHINGRLERIGGVRHNCVDCHTYHAGDNPLHGPGSPSRTPPADRRLDIVPLLRGGRE